MSVTQPPRLKPREIGLFLDVDGTLLDIAPRPEAVVVSARLRDDLIAAQRALDGALALISGRRIADLDQLFAPLRLRAAGVHGAEIRQNPQGATRSLANGHFDDTAWDALNRLLSGFPGAYAENKGVSFAIHYPEGTDASALASALSRLMTKIDPGARQLQLLAGREVFEIAPRGLDKGKAIAHFMTASPFRGRAPVFIGDDEIDRAAFDAALALGGLAFSVGVEMPGLSGAFAGPDAVRDWLHRLGR
jgi:trehalose 6-phosphate phosphatase